MIAVRLLKKCSIHSTTVQRSNLFKIMCNIAVDNKNFDKLLSMIVGWTVKKSLIEN